jgi:hypothetical protein
MTRIFRSVCHIGFIGRYLTEPADNAGRSVFWKNADMYLQWAIPYFLPITFIPISGFGVVAQGSHKQSGGELWHL